MKKWPEVLSKMFPVPGDMKMLDRPWWQRLEGGEFIRASDQRVCHYTWEINGMGSIDRAHPLPHPGFRVGQIWGIVNFSKAPHPDGTPCLLDVHVFTIDSAEFTCESEPEGRWWFQITVAGTLSRSGQHRTGGWIPELAVFSEPASGIDDSIGEQIRGPNAYLISDQACPWLAPWAPCEEEEK